MPAPTDTLRNEHRLILRALEVLESAARRVAADQALPEDWWSEMIGWFRAFADGVHHAKEERFLFPALLAAGLPVVGGPVEVMLEEHDQGRSLLREVEAGAPLQQAAAAERYVHQLRDHIAKENNVLFPLAEALLGQDAQQRLAVEFDSMEAESGPAGSLAHAEVAIERLAAALGNVPPRAERHAGDPPRAGEFWTERKVAWYQRALERSDYAEKVLGVLAAVLADCESALDVGAGCGALALPLARRLRRVTALEPAPAMAAALRRAAAAEGVRNIEVVEAGWGEVAVPPHDLVLCAHVGPLVHPASAFLRDVAAHAQRWVAIVRDAGRPQDKFFFRELYPLLLGRPYEEGRERGPAAGLEDIEPAPTITTITYRSDQPFTDLEEACDFWEEYLGVTGADARAELRAFLAPRLVRDGSGWLARYTKQAEVVYWPTGADACRARRRAGEGWV
jgi:hemerythrin-like domain-containing protein/protein-L-isoaspartate O-methyltransferase